MNNEIQEIVESRIHELATNREQCAATCEPGDTHAYDFAISILEDIVSDLKKRAADDSEPISEDWLRSVGFLHVVECEMYPLYRIKFRERSDPQFGHIEISGPAKSTPHWPWHATVDAGGGWPGPTKTRSDVRRLCAALGITLGAKP